MNARTHERAGRAGHLAGREWLFYRALSSDVALIRGTTADEDGNITLEHEATTREKTSRSRRPCTTPVGMVICQVKRLAPRGTLHPQHGEDAGLPGRPCRRRARTQWQTYASALRPGLLRARCGADLARIPPDAR